MTLLLYFDDWLIECCCCCCCDCWFLYASIALSCVLKLWYVGKDEYDGTAAIVAVVVTAAKLLFPTVSSAVPTTVDVNITVDEVRSTIRASAVSSKSLQSVMFLRSCSNDSDDDDDDTGAWSDQGQADEKYMTVAPDAAVDKTAGMVSYSCV